MKIGILTYNRAVNYGAALQMISLYFTLLNLKSSETQIEIIDYKSDFIEHHYKSFSFIDIFDIHKLKRIFSWNSYSFLNQKVFQDYFIKLNLTFSKEVYSNNFKKSVKNYDIIIVGSDQLWNMASNNFDKNYFLPLKSSSLKKFSYSVSLGSQDFIKSLPFFIKFLPDFKSISIREYSSVNKINSLSLGFKAHHHIDPTLLTDKSAWEKFQTKEISHLPSKFNLIYLIVEDASFIEFSKMDSISTPLIYITDRLMRPQGILSISQLNPGDWLKLFIESNKIFTNSYHGLLFSFILRKQVILKLLPYPAKVNIRITDFIDLLSLKYEMVDGHYYFDFRNLSKDILDKITILQNNSLNYLRNILNVNS